MEQIDEKKHNTYGHITFNNEPVQDICTLPNEFYSYFSTIARKSKGATST